MAAGMAQRDTCVVVGELDDLVFCALPTECPTPSRPGTLLRKCSFSPSQHHETQRLLGPELPLMGLPLEAVPRHERGLAWIMPNEAATNARVTCVSILVCRIR